MVNFNSFIAGRASATPSIDLFITLLSLGSVGYQQLLRQRKVCMLLSLMTANQTSDLIA